LRAPAAGSECSPRQADLAGRPSEQPRRWAIVGLAIVVVLAASIGLSVGRRDNGRSSAGFTPENRPLRLGLPAKGERVPELAADAARKANARRLQAVLSQHYAQNNFYPLSLAELSTAALGFAPNPQTYVYQATPDQKDYRLEVIMESDNVSGANIVTDGGVTKYIIQGD
jgi:hypothetical protein